MGEDWDSALEAGRDASALLDEQLASLIGSSGGPLDWRSLRSIDAAAAWDALRSWVEWFRPEYGFDHRVVPPCWYLHPALVSVLSSLRDLYVCAYEPGNTAAGSSEWHRVLMQLEPRLREWASRTGCVVGTHRPDVVAAYPDDQATWTAHVASDVAARAELEAHADDQSQHGSAVPGRASRSTADSVLIDLAD